MGGLVDLEAAAVTVADAMAAAARGVPRSPSPLAVRLHRAIGARWALLWRGRDASARRRVAGAGHWARRPGGTLVATSLGCRPLCGPRLRL
jgi:hypothetical protein